LHIVDVIRERGSADGGLHIADVIRERGPLTVAAFMDLALYNPAFGYYARAVRRSGRAGDFFTSVDVGPFFGQLLAVQIAEMAYFLGVPTDPAPSAAPALPAPPVLTSFDLVESGAGNGRLAADILRALALYDPQVYSALRLHLVEVSGEARGAQQKTLAAHGERLASSSSSVPDFEGVLIANELLDAMPVHQVVMREEGLREIYVDTVRTVEREAATELATREGPPSTPALAEYLSEAGVTLEPGWRAEINLRAVEWMRDVARRMRRGFLIVIDYGHESRELYSVTHSAGTLTTYSRHQSAGADGARLTPQWLRRPGEQDITAHVDFSSVSRAAEQEGCVTLGFLDQTYFIMGILEAGRSPSRLRSFRASVNDGRGTGDPNSADNRGARRDAFLPEPLDDLSFQDRLALKTLIMPGGLGSTMKVLVLGKGVGTPALACCSSRVRVT
jgi:SAM-dependent MidA family methyltransferase